MTIFSTDLIPVYTTDIGEKVVLGRELYEKLGIATEYTRWFQRMCEYGKDEGFTEGKSYSSVFAKTDENMGIGGRPKQDRIIILRMTKHIASIQKTNIGYDIREKLFDIEEMVSENHQKETSVDFQSILDSDASLKLLAETALALVEEREKARTLMIECQVKDEKISVLEPKANYYDLILQSSEVLTVSQIANDYDISPQEFNNILYKFRIQHKVNGQWVLYQEHKGNGYTVPRTYHYENFKGSGSNTLTCWTQKGRVFLYDFLKEKGIVPTIEREKYAEYSLVQLFQNKWVMSLFHPPLIMADDSLYKY